MAAKTDLLTAMVGEFPELQGRMGYYYATEDGEEAAVASAIEEQYLPRHAGDSLPTSPTGRVLALADRLDTLAGIFAVGEKPTGDKDPFGLRRAALGVVRILKEGGLALDLHGLIRKAVIGLGERGKTRDGADEVWAFLLDRLRGLYAEPINSNPS